MEGGLSGTIRSTHYPALAPLSFYSHIPRNHIHMTHRPLLLLWSPFFLEFLERMGGWHRFSCLKCCFVDFFHAFPSASRLASSTLTRQI